MRIILLMVVGLVFIGQSKQLAFIYEQCGGSGVSDTCDIGLACVYINQYYSQCLEDPSLASTGLPEWSQCGGFGYTGSTVCRVGLTCVYQNFYYSSCIRVRSTATPSPTTTTTGAPITTTTTATTPSTAAPTTTETASSSTTTSNQASQVPEWGQCGGIGYPGSTTCQQGLQCVFINSYYSQCQRTQQPTTQTMTTTTTRVATGTPTNRTFGSCNFLYGRSFTSDVNDYSQFDYITIWLGSDNGQGSTDFNIYWQGDMLNKAIAQNKIPLFYAYIIAFEGRNLQGLKDCDVGSPNLCQYGADFIRNNRAYLIGRYTHQASRIADYIGRDGVAVFLIEPDFWQYYGDPNQSNGPLSGDYMRSLFDDFAQAIRDQLPNAIISWDISAWLSPNAMQVWWGYFSSSPYISFIHTSGGSSRPDLANIKPNELTWAFMSQLTGKKIIADCGYGVGGSGQNNCYLWSDQTILNSRIQDGVIAVSQASSVYTPTYKPSIC